MNRTFSMHDQSVFAELSGDSNPLHVDDVAARRLLFGRPVVHGIHSLLWGLDCWLADHREAVTLTSLRGLFQKPIGLGRDVRYELSVEQEGAFEIKLHCDGDIATVIKGTFTTGQHSLRSELNRGDRERVVCRSRDFDDIAAASGSVPLSLNHSLAESLLPNVARALCPVQLAEILATTQLVGMECPGLHSVYSELTLKFSEEEIRHEPRLCYEVTQCQPRFSLVLMKVSAPHMSGTIKAFVRPEPQQQPSFATIRELVSPDEFAGQRAVIVGGSRGVGEVTAKLLAAGGADVAVTYYHGAEDARAIVDEINGDGGSAGSTPFNALYPRFEIPEAFDGNWQPTHLYYFATPKITTGPKGEFSADTFGKYVDYYVFGFLDTFRIFRNAGVQHVYYPSTVFVDELPNNMGEYGAVKAAGEKLCEFLDLYHPDVSIVTDRLPRMATDQTASFIPVSKQETVDVMLASLRKFATTSSSLQLAAQVLS